MLTAKNVRRLRVLDEGAPAESRIGDVAEENRNILRRNGHVGLEGWARISRQHVTYICSDCFEMIKPKDSTIERSIDARRDGLDKEGVNLLDPKRIKIIHNPKHEDYTLLHNE